VTEAVSWDPDQYLRYGDERARPFAELIARVGAVDPRRVVDLGCGPGNATASLLQRWPNAMITGVDSSPAMIAEAGQRAIPGRLCFEAGDVRTWRTPEPVDVIVSNATFQWVPGHVALFPQLLDQLRPRGWFALQVPGNFGAPSHVLLREVGRSPRWRDRLGALLRDDAVCEPGEYQAALAGLGCETDVWETTYLHVLQQPERPDGSAAESGVPGPERPGGSAAESGKLSLTVDAIGEARSSGVGRLITVGTDASTSAVAIEVARTHEGVWATVGLHPHDAVNGVASVSSLLDDVDPVVVAVGECGLDYHYDHSPRETQREAFAAQVALAGQLDLALVVHTREAWEDTFAILAAEGVPARTVFHCFTGGPDEAWRALSLGAWLSFSGIVTFKTAADVREAAALCPLDRLLVETDSPYLAPVPYRGQPNRPALVPVVGAAVAGVRGVDPGVVEEATWANTAFVFGLP
jgi:TatD DNase family protein